MQKKKVTPKVKVNKNWVRWFLNKISVPPIIAKYESSIFSNVLKL